MNDDLTLKTIKHTAHNRLSYILINIIDIYVYFIILLLCFLLSFTIYYYFYYYHYDKYIIQGVPQLSLLCQGILNQCVDYSSLMRIKKAADSNVTSHNFLTLNNEIAIISSCLCSNISRLVDSDRRIVLGQLVHTIMRSSFTKRKKMFTMSTMKQHPITIS